MKSDAAIRTALLLLIAAGIAPIGVADAAWLPAVSVIASDRLDIAGAGVIPLYARHDGQSRDLAAPQPDITRVVIVIHGRARNADVYLRTAEAAVAAAGTYGRGTLLIVPQFLADRDVAAPSPPPAPLHWGITGWIDGKPAHGPAHDGGTTRGPAAISSFDVIDGILDRLADRGRFPNLTQVVLAGHSAGGQMVQRYAVVGRGTAASRQLGIAVRYVVANPSSYVYFSTDRPARDGSAVCPGFNRWKYGLVDMPPYAAAQSTAGAGGLEAGYAARDVVYLLGAADTDPRQPALDKSCAGEAQGPSHYARGLAYWRYLRARHPTGLAHRLWPVPGIGHDGRGMLLSACGLAALFDRPGCDTP
ncbi:MAG TPA: hypothetical protein VNT30_12680 [Stellaceae bacterium]|nr:hypothetical protein [Stellaceae bacterium]